MNFFLKAGHQRVRNQHKMFWVIKALFANFKSKCEHFKHIAKSKKLIFAKKSYHSPFDS